MSADQLPYLTERIRQPFEASHAHRVVTTAPAYDPSRNYRLGEGSTRLLIDGRPLEQSPTTKALFRDLPEDSQPTFSPYYLALLTSSLGPEPRFNNLVLPSLPSRFYLSK